MRSVPGGVLAVVLFALPLAAQTAVALVPPEPSWEWTVRYAAARLSADSQTWANGIQQIPADGNNLTPAQLQILQQTTDSVLASITTLRSELDKPFPLVTCPATLDHALTQFVAAYSQLSRDANPPWTVHDHQALFAPLRNLILGFRSEIGCFPSYYTVSPAPPQLGPDSIHGRVLDAAGAPLAGASVDAGEAGLGWQATTRTDGSWSLTGLPAACFLLTARLPGYFEAQQITSSAGAPTQMCSAQIRGAAMTGATGAVPGPKGAITFRLAPSGITDVPYGPLVAAYPFEQTDLSSNLGRWSPNGRFLALVFNIDLWRYNLADGRMIKLGPLPEKYWEARLQLAWVGGKVLIFNLGPQGFKGYLEADASGIRPASLSAAAGQAAFASPALHSIALGGTAGPFTVTSRNLGHGNVHLFVQRGAAAPDSIAAGNWELDSSFIDADRQRVYYPTFARPDNKVGIVTYDLATGASRLTLIPNRAQRLVRCAFPAACAWPTRSLAPAGAKCSVLPVVEMQPAIAW